MSAKLHNYTTPQVLGFYCGIKGIVIQYLFQGIIKHLSFNPYEAARVLAYHRLMDDYILSAGQVLIEWEEEGTDIIAPWDVFVKSFLLTEKLSKLIATRKEMEEAEERRASMWQKIVNNLDFNNAFQ